jgi:hypothetical protein
VADTAEETSLLKSGKRIMNYHPAFENTLLGLRLMQMDILILAPPVTGALPCDAQGKVILGAGETAPVKEDAYKATMDFQYRVNINGAYRSYIVKDKGRQMKFGRKNDSLVISGNLSYWFWDYRWQSKTDKKLTENNFSTIQSNVNMIIMNRLNSIGADPMRLAWLGDTLRVMAANHLELMPFGQISSPLLKKYESLSPDMRGGFIESLDMQERYNMAVAFATVAEWSIIESRPEVAKVVDENRTAIRALNPQVWDAAEATMRVSAFLRYVKKHSPDSWKSLVKSAKLHREAPSVATPHILDESFLRSGGK